jgi:heme oxygenase
MEELAMAGRKIELELSASIYADLERIAEAMGIASVHEAAAVGLAQWVERRKSELDDRDPDERYFVNEALDDLIRKKS